MKRALNDFILNTSAHGIGRVFFPVASRKSSQCFRFIWLVTWIAAAAYLSHEIYVLVKDFTEYKTSTKMSLEMLQPIAFPTVTICPIIEKNDVSILDILTDDLQKFGKNMKEIQMAKMWEFNFRLDADKAKGNCFSFNAEGDRNQELPGESQGIIP